MPRKTTPKSAAVVLFEDNPKYQEIRRKQIQQVLGQSVPVLLFDDSSIRQEKDASVETTLERELKSPKFCFGRIGLIVCDKELAIYSKVHVTSDSIVSAVAESLGIPICLYERGDKETGGVLDKFKRWKQKEIVVDEDRRSFGLECAGLYRGFASISRAIKEIPPRQFSTLTPADILARLLGKKEEADRIALYGAGEQSMLVELLPYYDHQSKSHPTRAIKQRYYRVLGNWLYNSVLRFPGIVVNRTAAASFLNINQDDFLKPRVQKLFTSAAYSGPFSECGQWWWRRDLEKLLAAAECETGLDYAKKEGLKRLRLCPCAHDGSHSAGYYCMISEMPICEEHSRGGISWFPGGADLARISQEQFAKIGPFMGLF